MCNRTRNVGQFPELMARDVRDGRLRPQVWAAEVGMDPYPGAPLGGQFELKDRMGTGDWLRGKSEHCLMCVRGRPLVTLTNQTTILEGPVREHSRKPDEFFALVESLCPGLKLEMFSREPRTGWTCIGAELGVFGAK